ncbi:MFS transporter [bacterium AH-315-K03]|nr:MFS transporter [bacterium AH-315-K03]
MAINRDILLLIQGHFLSLLGSYIFMVGFTIWLKESLKSAAMLGIYLMLSRIPSAIISPFCGVIIDRCSRKKIIIISDLVSGFLFLAVALVAMLQPTNINLIIVVLFLGSVCSSVSSSFVSPATNAIIPDIVKYRDVKLSYGAIQSATQIAGVLGQALGGILYLMVGLPLFVLINAISYFLSSFVKSFIEVPSHLDRCGDRKSFGEELREGIRYVRYTKGVAGLFFIVAVLGYCAGSVFILLLFLTENILNVSFEWYGYFISGQSAGLILGSLFVSFVNIKACNRFYWMVISLFIFGISFGLIGYTPGTFKTLFLLVVSHACFGFINVLIISSLLSTLQSEIRGRVSSLLTAMAMVIVPITYGLTGLIIDFVGGEVVIIFATYGFIIIVSGMYFLFRKESRIILNCDEVGTE